jgi:hypothetical protein
MSPALAANHVNGTFAFDSFQAINHSVPLHFWVRSITLRRALLDYCGQDALGMVKIVEILCQELLNWRFGYVRASTRLGSICRTNFDGSPQ